MRIESALFSSREGLMAHGVGIAVIGDNISNQNTVAFKAARVSFQDLMAEGADGARSTATPVGGNGVKVAKVVQNHTTGTIEFTGRALDSAISGKGFYIIGDTSNPVYTRAGNFSIDEDGLLSTSDGTNVLGFTGATGTTLGTLQMLDLNLNGSPTTAASLTGNVGSENAITTAPTAPATFNAVAENASYISTLSIFDSFGTRHEATIAFYKTAINTWTVQAYLDGGDLGQTTGTPVQIGANGTLNFSGTGLIEDANQAAATITGTPAFSNGSAATAFTIDFSDFTQFGGTSLLTNITQNGQSAGNVKDYEIRKDGGIFALLESGTSLQIGRLPLANFANEGGLDRGGNSFYVPTELSGTPTNGTAGQGGLGAIEGSSLERSTVDMAKEFVELVLMQRGYQANSQVLNAANGIIRDTLGLVR